jgi:hypothetical protein
MGREVGTPVREPALWPENETLAISPEVPKDCIRINIAKRDQWPHLAGQQDGPVLNSSDTWF